MKDLTKNHRTSRARILSTSKIFIEQSAEPVAKRVPKKFTKLIQYSINRPNHIDN